jgi:hypothetical protein
MGKPCRLTFFAYKYGMRDDPRGYDKDDLLNGIGYAEDLLSVGHLTEPHDDFDLKGYIGWADREIERIQ